MGRCEEGEQTILFRTLREYSQFYWHKKRNKKATALKMLCLSKFILRRRLPRAGHPLVTRLLSILLCTFEPILFFVSFITLSVLLRCTSWNEYLRRRKICIYFSFLINRQKAKKKMIKVPILCLELGNCGFYRPSVSGNGTLFLSFN